MRFLSIFASALCLTSTLVSGLAIQERGDGFENSLEARGRSRGGSRKYQLTKPPSKGQTGVYTHPKTKVTTIHYGDSVKQHAAHVSYHNSVYPAHANKVFKPASAQEGTANRNKALAKVKSQGKMFVRDEKPLASLSHGGKSSTVVKVDRHESLIEAQLAREAKRQAKASKGIALKDNRLKPSAGDLGKILKARNIIDDVEGEFSKLENKLLGLIKSVTDDLKDAGGDIVTAVEQVAFPESHQMGAFYQGFNIFDDLEDTSANNGTVSDDDLAQDAAAINVYGDAYNKATGLLGNATAPLYADDASDDDDSSDDTPSNSTQPDTGDKSGDDDECEEDDSEDDQKATRSYYQKRGMAFLA